MKRLRLPADPNRRHAWSQRLRGLLAVGAISTGVAFIYWPAAPIVAGFLLLADLLTD